MGALEEFSRNGVRLEIEGVDNLRAFSTLSESVRSAIKARKQELVRELQWREFESLLAVVGKAFRTPPPQYREIRETAGGDLNAALVAYREMAAQIGSLKKIKINQTGKAGDHL